MKSEITIAGGGLAGLSLGVALRLRNVPVVLHEAGTYPRHRVCGEFICGVRRETLQKLGIEGNFSEARSCKESVWYREDEFLGPYSIPGDAMAISRWLLDDALRRNFESLGGQLRTSSRLSREPAEGLVWCAGRAAARDGKWIGLKCHMRGMPTKADLEMHIGRNGYAGVAAIEDGLVNICGLFRLAPPRGCKGTDLLLENLRRGGNLALARRMENAEIVKESFCGVAGFHLGRQDGRSRVLSLGDAESMIPPFTGNGMSMAFEAAEAAVEFLCQYSQNELSWPQACEKVRHAIRVKFRRRMTVASLIHPLLTSSQASLAFGYAMGRPWVPRDAIFQFLR